MKIAISGASSFVGTNIIEELIKQYQDADIYALIRPNSPNNKKIAKFGNRINVLEVDMGNIQELTNLIDGIDVFYLNAWNGTRGADRLNEEMQKNNYTNSILAINTAIKLGAKTIIGVGSQAEYGITNTFVDEESEAKPNTAYGKYKLMLYTEGLSVCKKNNVEFKWGRIFSSYGTNDNENTLVMYCIKNMLNNCDVDVSPCKQMWNFINIKDVACLFVKMISDKIPSGVYNLASNDTRVLSSFIEEMYLLTNASCKINYGAVQTNIKLMNLMPRISKIEKHFPGYKFISFSTGVREIINSYRK